MALVEQFAGAGAFGAAFLGDVEFFGREGGKRLWAFFVMGHGASVVWCQGIRWGERRKFKAFVTGRALQRELNGCLVRWGGIVGGVLCA